MKVLILMNGIVSKDKTIKEMHCFIKSIYVNLKTAADVQWKRNVIYYK